MPEPSFPPLFVIPAKAGIQQTKNHRNPSEKQKPNRLDSRLRGNDAGAGIVIPAKAGIQPPNATGIHRKNRNLQTVIPTEVGIQ